MKYIHKGKEPIEFIEWKIKFNADENKKFDEISGKPKSALREALIHEQGYICCYCETRVYITFLDNGEVEHNNHIEHLRPQSEFPGEKWDYNNLLVSCQRDVKKIDPKHCGTSKDNIHNPKMVSPLHENCEEQFRFDIDGFIEPMFDIDGFVGPMNENDTSALETINILKLDIYVLNESRKEAIADILDNLPAEDEELRKLIDGFKIKNSSGYYSEFCSAVSQVLALVLCTRQKIISAKRIAR